MCIRDRVIVALTALGIDPQKDARFLKNGRSVLDALCDFVLDDGFYHSAELVEVNGMATEQADVYKRQSRAYTVSYSPAGETVIVAYRAQDSTPLSELHSTAESGLRFVAYGLRDRLPLRATVRLNGKTVT